MKEVENEVVNVAPKDAFYNQLGEVSKNITNEVEELEQEIGAKHYDNENRAVLQGLDYYENQFDYQKAAKLYVLKTARLPQKDIEKEGAPEQMAAENNYDLDQWERAFRKDLNKKAAELSRSAYFQYFVRDYLVKGSEAGHPFSPDGFAKAYDEYVEKTKEATKEWTDLIPDMEEGNLSITHAQALARQAIREAEKYRPDEKVSPTKNVKEAVDYIIAQSICTDVAEHTFFKGIPSGKENLRNPEKNKFEEVTLYNQHQLAQRVFSMRKQILEDPVFQSTITEGHVTLKDVNKAYRKNLGLETNKKIRQEKNKISKLDKQGKTQQYESFLQKKDNTFDKEQMEQLKQLHDELKSLNEGKDPSDQMTALMNALETVANGNRSAVAAANLNKAAMDYYSDRQGIFFSPFTDKGKARLEASQKLIRITSPAIKKLDQEFAAENKQVKEQGKKMAGPK